MSFQEQLYQSTSLLSSFSNSFPSKNQIQEISQTSYIPFMPESHTITNDQVNSLIPSATSLESQALAIPLEINCTKLGNENSFDSFFNSSLNMDPSWESQQYPMAASSPTSHKRYRSYSISNDMLSAPSLNKLQLTQLPNQGFVSSLDTSAPISPMANDILNQFFQVPFISTPSNSLKNSLVDFKSNTLPMNTPIPQTSVTPNPTAVTFPSPKPHFSQPSEDYPIPASQKLAQELILQGKQSEGNEVLPTNYPSYLIKNHHKSIKERKRAERRIRLIDFDDVTVTELKDILRALGKCATGKKTDLMERVKDEHDRIVKEGASACTTPSCSVKSSPTLSTVSVPDPKEQAIPPRRASWNAGLSLHTFSRNSNFPAFSPIKETNDLSELFPSTVNDTPTPSPHNTSDEKNNRARSNSCPNPMQQATLNLLDTSLKASQSIFDELFNTGSQATFPLF